MTTTERPVGEKRAWQRRRTRLRPGKLLGDDGLFLKDCAILDTSAAGALVRIFDGGDELPEEIVLFDERETTRQPARLVWTSGFLVGLSFAAPGETVEPEEFQRIAGRYYAVGR